MKTKEYPAAKSGEERYVEYDSEFECWAVFGKRSLTSEKYAEANMEDHDEF